ncbi:unnamed protein product, partial [Rotaria magnacalcarata]
SQIERRDQSSNAVNTTNSNVQIGSQRQRQPTRNFPFLTPNNNNNAPTPIARR